MKSLFVAIVLVSSIVGAGFAPTTLAAPAVASPSTNAGCTPARYDFPGAVNPAMPNGALTKDHRRTIAVLGRQGFGMGCSVTVVCTSVDNTKASFEAVKIYCKSARDAIASGKSNPSAAKAQITIRAARPEDGFAAGSVTLILS